MVSSDVVSVIPDNIVGAYVDKQERVVVRRMDELLQVLCDALNLGFMQAHTSQHISGNLDWPFCPLQKGVTIQQPSSLPSC